MSSAAASLPKTYKAWFLNDYAKGPINENTFRLVDQPMPDVNNLKPNHILVRTQRVAMEPSMRPSISLGKSYREPHPLSDPMWAFGIGEIVASTSDAYPVGRQVAARTEMQEYVLIDVSQPGAANLVDPRVGLEYLSGLGAPGRAAYWGLVEVGKVTKDDVVLVSAAGGATGQVVTQIAKAIGAKRVIGIASKGKRQAVLDAGADECLDYGASDFAEQLRKVTEEQVTLYFDNTGGPITDAALGCMAPHGRMIICGSIGDYQRIGSDDKSGYHGMKNWRYILTMRLTVQGFTIPDCTPQEHRRTTEQLAGYIAQGKVKTTIFTYPEKGIEYCIKALEGLFTGMNTGKMTLVVAD